MEYEKIVLSEKEAVSFLKEQKLEAEKYLAIHAEIKKQAEALGRFTHGRDIVEEHWTSVLQNCNDLLVSLGEPKEL